MLTEGRRVIMFEGRNALSTASAVSAHSGPAKATPLTKYLASIRK